MLQAARAEGQAKLEAEQLRAAEAATTTAAVAAARLIEVEKNAAEAVKKVSALRVPFECSTSHAQLPTAVLHVSCAAAHRRRQHRQRSRRPPHGPPSTAPQVIEDGGVREAADLTALQRERALKGVLAEDLATARKQLKAAAELRYTAAVASERQVIAL